MKYFNIKLKQHALLKVIKRQRVIQDIYEGQFITAILAALLMSFQIAFK